MRGVLVSFALALMIGAAGCGNEEEQRRLRAAHMTDEQLRQYADTPADPAMKAIVGDEIARRKKLREQAAKENEKKTPMSRAKRDGLHRSVQQRSGNDTNNTN